MSAPKSKDWSLAAILSGVPGFPGSCVLCGSRRNVAARHSHDGVELCSDCIVMPDTPVALVLDLLGLSHTEAAEWLGIGRLPVLRAAHGRPVRRRAAEALHKLTGLTVADLMAGATDVDLLKKRRTK